MGGKLILNTQSDKTTLTNNDSVTKVKFVKDNFVIKSGDSMMGNLDIGSSNITTTAVPLAVSDLTNKNYVDDNIATNIASLVAKSSNTMTGMLSMGSNKITTTYNPVAPFDLTSKMYVDAEISAASASTITTTDANYLKKSGGTVTGAIEMAASEITSTYVPASTSDLTNKQYVDSVTQSQVIGGSTKRAKNSVGHIPNIASLGFWCI